MRITLVTTAATLLADDTGALASRDPWPVKQFLGVDLTNEPSKSTAVEMPVSSSSSSSSSASSFSSRSLSSSSSSSSGSSKSSSSSTSSTSSSITCSSCCRSLARIPCTLAMLMLLVRML
uniref:Putative cell wall integrity and stress response component 1 n=1 Tax=Anopheles braziliensis TaxID=58242 RepID=A0A2M3ZM62_9DIPT